MDSLYELAEDLQPGNYLAWQAENGKSVDKTRPKTVQKVEKQGAVIRVEADGPGDGEYHFTVDETGDSKSYYHLPSGESKPMGALIFAERTDLQAPVTIKHGWHDNS